tara:strand:- start:689 stop:1348 length:660 start_codon:yes stop_codon:yes gene_type:complete
MGVLLPLLGSRMKLIEMIALQADVKPVIRQSYYEEDLPLLYEFCKNNNLFIVKSKFKVVPLDSDKSFSNKGLRVKLTDIRTGTVFVYISKTELNANRAALWELRGNHYLLGRELGYPRCCCRFFNEHRHAREQTDNNFEEPVLDSSQGETFSAVGNIFHRDKDACLISHFPCSLSCNESVKIGSAIMNAVTEKDFRMAAGVLDRLKGEQVVKGRNLNFL